MIQELHVKSFALINDARLEFKSGFNVITGETGAGKSLIIDALLVIAGRGGSDFVRTGCEQAVVEAVFSATEELKSLFEEIGDEDFISLRKVITKTGKTKQYINGNFVSQARIKSLFGRLLHVYGQNETKDLYDEAYQRELYDLYCDNKNLLEELKVVLQAARDYKRQLLELEEKELTRAKEIDFIEYQLNEIRSANLMDDNEEEHLLEVRNRLLARDRILKNLGSIYEMLYAGETNVFDLLSQCNRLLTELNTNDDFFCDTEGEIKAAAETIKNRALLVKSFLEDLENTEEDINKVEGRLDTIYKLKKKYGGSIAEIKAFLKNQEERLNELKNIEIQKESLEEKLKEIRQKILSVAEKLTEKREKNIKVFEEGVKKELAELGMPKSSFKVVLNRVPFNFAEELPLYGNESVQFLFSSHSGEEAKPLSKIASGGELSRVMLAIKNIIPREKAMTVIFDEVDTGVGGRTAEMLGVKLKEIARHHQVICITHLPLVAVFGKNHFKVEKYEKNGKLDIKVSELTAEERLEEITRMLGGDTTSKGFEYAKEIFKKAQSA